MFIRGEGLDGRKNKKRNLITPIVFFIRTRVQRGKLLSFNFFKRQTRKETYAVITLRPERERARSGVIHFEPGILMDEKKKIGFTEYRTNVFYVKCVAKGGPMCHYPPGPDFFSTTLRTLSSSKYILRLYDSSSNAEIHISL